MRKGAQEGRRAFENITEQGFEVGKQVAGGLVGIDDPLPVLDEQRIGRGFEQISIAPLARDDSFAETAVGERDVEDAAGRIKGPVVDLELRERPLEEREEEPDHAAFLPDRDPAGPLATRIKTSFA